MLMLDDGTPRRSSCADAISLRYLVRPEGGIYTVVAYLMVCSFLMASWTIVPAVDGCSAAQPTEVSSNPRYDIQCNTLKYVVMVLVQVSVPALRIRVRV
jgi:hypothetical protein